MVCARLKVPDIDFMDSYIHLSTDAFSLQHFDILLRDKDDEETDMPLLHVEVFQNPWNGKPDINIRINNNRQWEGMDMLNAIPKHGYIRSGMARHTESCDLDVSFPDGSDMNGDDEDNEDDDDDSQGMDGGEANCAE